MDTFSAGVQYNDFKGTVAADISDNVALGDHLVSLGKAEKDERVVGFILASGENRGTPVTDVSLVAYLLRSADFESAPAEVRAVEVRVTPGEALALLKRFDLVAAARRGFQQHPRRWSSLRLSIIEKYHRECPPAETVGPWIMH